jgi:hypothetical protein
MRHSRTSKNCRDALPNQGASATCERVALVRRIFGVSRFLGFQASPGGHDAQTPSHQIASSGGCRSCRKSGHVHASEGPSTHPGACPGLPGCRGCRRCRRLHGSRKRAHRPASRRAKHAPGARLKVSLLRYFTYPNETFDTPKMSLRKNRQPRAPSKSYRPSRQRNPILRVSRSPAARDPSSAAGRVASDLLLPHRRLGAAI